MKKNGVSVTSGSYTLRGGKLGTCKVEVQLEYPNLKGQIEVANPSIPDEAVWTESWRFGVAYAIEKAVKLRPGLIGEGLRVIPTHIATHDPDGTSFAVAFAAIFSVWDALKFVSPNPPRIEKGAFIFGD